MIECFQNHFKAYQNQAHALLFAFKLLFMNHHHLWEFFWSNHSQSFDFHYFFSFISCFFSFFLNPLLHLPNHPHLYHLMFINQDFDCFPKYLIDQDYFHQENLIELSLLQTANFDLTHDHLHMIKTLVPNYLHHYLFLFELRIKIGYFGYRYFVQFHFIFFML